jgi:hypothetical protein
VIFNPNSSRQVRLMLAPREGVGDRGRGWEERRVPRKSARGQNASIEGSLEWLSWHAGMAHGRVVETGIMPPLAASGTIDTRYQYMGLLPPRIHAVTGTFSTRFLFEHASYIWSVGKDEAGANWLLVKIDPATQAVLTTFTLGVSSAGQPLSVVIFDGVAYIGMGFVVNVWKIAANGTTVTQATGTVKWAYAAVVGNKLAFNVTNNQIHQVASGADPFTTGNWSGAITTGDSVPITSLSGLTRVLYIGREDGLNGLDNDFNLVNLLPEIKAYVDEENVKVVTNWHGALALQHSRGFFYYTEGLTQLIGTERIKTNTTSLQGFMRGLTPDGEWLWGLMQGEGLTYYLVCGRERTGGEPGEGPMAWFVLGEFAGLADIYDALRMTVSTKGDSARLWFPNPQTGQVAWVTLPDLNAPPTEPGVTGDFAPTAHLDLPIVNMGSPMVPKYLKSVEVDAGNLAGGRTVTVWLAKDPTSAAPTFTQIPGTITTTGRTELVIPDGVMVREGQLRVVLTTNDPANSPVLKRIALNYVERPVKMTVVTLNAVVGAGVQSGGGAEMQVGGTDVRDRLYAMEEKGPQTVIDPYGKKGQWVVLEVATAEAENREDPSSPLLAVQMVLEEVG